MRARLLLFVGLAAILLSPEPGQTQFPGGGDPKGGRPGGGEFKGPKGGKGFGKRGGDPNTFIRAPMDQRAPGSFDPNANGPMPFGGPGESRGASDGRGGRDGWNPDAMVEAMFRRQDQNGDGLLNYDEMPEALRAERDKWDTNRDGFIDLNEFKAYMQARIQQAMLDRGDRQSRGGDALGGDDLTAALETNPNQLQKRPVVYHAGKLPKELPSWFAELDRDKDAQVGLYEWKDSGRSIEEFQMYDRNQDGFITVEEVLRYMAQNKDKPGSASDSLAMSNGRGGPGSEGMPFRGPGGRGGRGSDGGPGGRGMRGAGPGRDPGSWGGGDRPGRSWGPRGGGDQ